MIWRIPLLYVGALLFIMMLVPWTSIGLTASPLVIAFRDVGIPAAPGIINFVVITAALSAFNSGLYSTGRMLLKLAENHEAPARFRTSRGGNVPYVGILFSAGVLSIGVVVDLVLPERAFLYLSSIATVSLITTWTMILVTQWLFRRAKSSRRDQRRPTVPTVRLAGHNLCRAGRDGAGGGDGGVPIDDPQSSLYGADLVRSPRCRLRPLAAEWAGAGTLVTARLGRPVPMKG